ncbi:MAG: hypothetical protein V3T70_11630, partial [Phycisphaerae bacterium]
RVKAALAIGRAMPRESFDRAHLVMPVLSEALTLSTRRAALVVEPDDQVRNKLSAVLRAGTWDAVTAEGLYSALKAAHDLDITHFDVVLLASDTHKPELADAVRELRGDFVTAAVPIVIVMKAGDTATAVSAARIHAGISTLDVLAIEGGTPEQAAGRMFERYRRAASALGIVEITEDLSLDLAMQALGILHDLALSRSTVLDYVAAEPALSRVLSSSRPESLRIAAANVLAMIDTSSAQQTVAAVALDAGQVESMRLAAFSALATSARRNSNKLPEDTVDHIVRLTLDDSDLIVRTAASQVLGALDLPSNHAAEIIRTQSRG